MFAEDDDIRTQSQRCIEQHGCRESVFQMYRGSGKPGLMFLHAKFGISLCQRKQFGDGCFGVPVQAQQRLFRHPATVREMEVDVLQPR